MALITTGQRIFFAVICAAALLVAALGLFNPAFLASIFTWLELPPLHARFVGAIYAFGAAFMAGCLAARYQAEVRWAVQLIGIWTGMLFIISLLNLDAFDFNLLPVQIWFASYIIYPIIALWMTLQQPDRMKAGDLPGLKLSGLAKGFLLIQGISLYTVSSTSLYGACLHDYALAVESDTRAGADVCRSLVIVWAGKPDLCVADEVVGSPGILPGMLVFSVTTVIISFIHIGLFSFNEVPDLIWFGWFIPASLILALLTVRALQVHE